MPRGSVRQLANRLPTLQVIGLDAFKWGPSRLETTRLSSYDRRYSLRGLYPDCPACPCFEVEGERQQAAGTSIVQSQDSYVGWELLLPISV